MSELSCDTPFIGQIETHDLVRNLHTLNTKQLCPKPPMHNLSSYQKLYWYLGAGGDWYIHVAPFHLIKCEDRLVVFNGHL